MIFAQEVISHGHNFGCGAHNVDGLDLRLIKCGWVSWLPKTMEHANILNKFAEIIF